MEDVIYPSIAERVKAVFIDAFIAFMLMLVFTGIFEKIGNVSDGVRIGTMVFIFLLYDPLLTTFFGGTIGHMSTGLRVKNEEDEAYNIGIWQAMVRHVVKVLLGWISFLTVTGNEKRRAIHDLAVGSVVVYVKK